MAVEGEGIFLPSISSKTTIQPSGSTTSQGHCPRAGLSTGRPRQSLPRIPGEVPSSHSEEGTRQPAPPSGPAPPSRPLHPAAPLHSCSPGAALPHQVVLLVAHLRGVSPHAVDGEQQVQESKGGVQPEEIIPVGGRGSRGVLSQQGQPPCVHASLKPPISGFHPRPQPHPDFKLAMVVLPKL